MNILITCPRAPVSIEWIRIVERSGHQALLVDALDYPVGRFYKKIPYHKVPSPRTHFEAYKEAMFTLFESVDMVIPNCEDIFFLSKIRADYRGKLSFFMPEDRLLFTLHHKIDFFKTLNSHVSLPKSHLITHKDQILLNPKSLLKPIYSRFGRDVIRSVTASSIQNITVGKTYPWVQQQFITGTALCAYALCQKGQLISAVIYRPKYLLNGAASTYFEYVEDTQCQRFLETFAQENAFHGQVAFDFIKEEDTLYVLECNPRATSGLHIISDEIYIDKSGIVQAKKVQERRSCRVSISLYLLFGLKALMNGTFSQLNRDHKKAKDVMVGVPLYAQLLSLYEMLKRALVFRRPVTSASTFDIEYDGESSV